MFACLIYLMFLQIYQFKIYILSYYSILTRELFFYRVYLIILRNSVSVLLLFLFASYLLFYQMFWNFLGIMSYLHAVSIYDVNPYIGSLCWMHSSPGYTPCANAMLYNFWGLVSIWWNKQHHSFIEIFLSWYLWNFGWDEMCSI